MRAPSIRLSKRLIIVIVASLALAVVTSWHALVMSTRALRPEVALRLDADEPVATVRSLASEAGASLAAKKGLPADTFRKARMSLQGSPLNPVALRFAAMSSPGKSVENPDAALLVLSDRVSRRDFATQMLLVGVFQRQGSLPKVLHAYDTALRSTRASWPLLFPPLAQLLLQPNAAPSFGVFFDRKSPWLSSFLTVSLNEAEQPLAFFDLLIRQRRLLQLDQRRNVQNVLVNQLVARNRVSEARDAFLFDKAGSSGVLTSPALNAETLRQNENTLYWFFPNNPGLYASPVANRYLSVSVESGRSGTVAQKMLYLQPGRYALRTAVDRSEAETGLRMEWNLQCLRNGVADVSTIPLTSSGDGIALVRFSMPSDCSAARLLLTAGRAPTATASNERVIESIALERDPIAPSTN